MLFFDDLQSYDEFRLERLHQGEVNIRGNLFVFNLIIFAVGGGVSYFFARRTIRPIEDALEAQTRFTADASHELRTPLAVMQTEIEVGLRDKQLTSIEAKKILTSNLEEVTRVRRLVDGLLRLARNGGALENAKRLDIAMVAKSALQNIQKQANAKNIQVQLELSSAMVRGDKENLVELATILLDNAIKYSPRGASIWLKTYIDGKNAVLMIADEGEGIKASQLEHIFDRFYRADTSRSKQKVEGFGIGLSIAKQIAEAHGGVVEAHSKLGEGSTFLVKLARY
jgi:signal transduction histidine kinase